MTISRKTKTWPVTCLMLFALSQPAWAQLKTIEPVNEPVPTEETADPTAVVAIEEDWEVQVLAGDPMQVSPQWSTVFNLPGGQYFFTTWNFIDHPNFVAGGFQMQAWNGETCKSVFPCCMKPLQYNSDVIRWTTRVEIVGTGVNMKMKNLVSNTWGKIAETTSLRFPEAQLPDPNIYDSEKSIFDSQINFGKNRVNWFGMKEVRAYNSAGKVIYQNSDDKVGYRLTDLRSADVKRIYNLAIGDSDPTYVDADTTNFGTGSVILQ